MRVKLRTRMSGPKANYQPGEIVELPDETAEQLVLSEQAELVAEAAEPEPPVEPPVEVAVEPEPPERAAKVGRKRRGR